MQFADQAGRRNLGTDAAGPRNRPTYFRSVLDSDAWPSGRRATERGHDLLLSRVIAKDPDWLNHVVDSGRVDGVILIGQPDQLAVIDKVPERYVPLVAWGTDLSG